MKKLTGFLLGISFLFGGFSIVAAQEKSDTSMNPPKILVIYREYLKPGRAGSIHEKSERAFVKAFSNAKWPTHYFAADSLSGRPRTLFFQGYDSFDAWEKDHVAMMKNPALGALLDKAALADGDLLSDTDQSVLSLREDQSLRSSLDIAKMRGFEISLFRVKPGHRKDWDDLVKLVMAAYEKVPDVRWVTFQLLYGQQEGGTYVIFSPFKGGADLDKEADQDKQFVAAMGEDGMKKLSELESAAVESSQTNLFVFNPAISYPEDEWIKSDPDFWKPKATKPMGAPKKAPEKPAGAQ